MRTALFVAFAMAASLPLSAASPPQLDESPATDEQWGYRPSEGFASETSPPSFSWRPQAGIASWEIECRSRDDSEFEYRADSIEFNVHCPDRSFPSGSYAWRYRGVDKDLGATGWSKERSFTIAEDAVPLPLPRRAELLSRIPVSHPRLFLRPEDVPRLRELAQGPMKDSYTDLVARCEKLMANPPPTEEPSKYPADVQRPSPEWKKLWWGNRTYTIDALDGAATLAFTRLIGGKQEYGQLAKRILLDCAQWDPRGATGYRYNDEAGMPYAYYFSRTYTFVHDLLNEEQRDLCQRVMTIRGREMYDHLCPRHFWQPYSSHSNRAWHFLGEVGIAFHGEIEEADDWVWFATNVFFNVYPVWSDDDGGWHEGVSYWSSYIGRFTWWADVMRSALDISAFDKPYFSKVGYYPIYLLPPGKVGGAFGDGATRRTARDVVPLMSQLAAQAGNGHWQWYVEENGGPVDTSGYVGFIRGGLPRVDPDPPVDLPTSRLFRGTGQAFLNTNLENADEDVQIIFKSSPMGTRSHGNAANNSFVLWAYGERLLTRTGHYYMYAGPHHRDWVWSTRSLNNITVGGQGQVKRSANSKGSISAFHTTPTIDVVVGEAAEAYLPNDSNGQPLLDRYTRAIVFVKPELMIVFDRLEAPQPSTFEYWLHAINEFQIDGQHQMRTRVGDVVCEIDILAPEGLQLSQTDQYDPNPWPQITTREWHLTATTPSATSPTEFVAIYRPHRISDTPPPAATLSRTAGGYVLEAELSDGRLLALLPTDDSATLKSDDLATDGRIAVRRYERDGTVVQTIKLQPHAGSQP